MDGEPVVSGGVRVHDLAWNRCPFGWVLVDGRLIPDAGEQECLDRMWELRERRFHSYKSAARILNAEGRPAKRGGPWYPSTVRTAMLRAVAVEKALTGTSWPSLAGYWRSAEYEDWD
jgi:hypothetical protein